MKNYLILVLSVYNSEVLFVKDPFCGALTFMRSSACLFTDFDEATRCASELETSGNYPDTSFYVVEDSKLW